MTSLLLTTALASSLLLNPISSYSLGDLNVTINKFIPESTPLVTANESLYTVDESVFADEVTKFQFTPEQVTAANKTTVDLLVKDYINSGALNATRDEYNTFIDSRTGYSPELLETMKAPEKPGTSYTPVVPLTTPDSLVPDFIEDSKPKMENTEVELKQVSATEYQKTPQLILEYNFTAPYRVSDEEVLNYVRLLNSVKTESVNELVKPKVLEPGDNNVFLVEGTVAFTVTPKDGDWEVVSVKTGYQYDVTDFAKVKSN